MVEARKGVREGGGRSRGRAALACWGVRRVCSTSSKPLRVTAEIALLVRGKGGRGEGGYDSLKRKDVREGRRLGQGEVTLGGIR